MSASGYFTAYINERAYRPSQADRALMGRISQLTREALPGSQVHWAGSQRKGTALVGSDLDMCVERARPITEAERRELREALERGLGRPARVLSHAIRLPGQPKVDLAFVRASFGGRPLPQVSTFHDHPPRQEAARALKLWSRGAHLPRMPGWVAEALVVFRDQRSPTGLALFLRTLDWLGQGANASAVESVLRPQAAPAWREGWSKKLPGQLQAYQNRCRALAKGKQGPETWTCPEDVGRWLGV